MAVTEETVRLKFDVQGEEALTAEMAHLTRVIDTATVSTDKFAMSTQKVGKGVGSLQQQITAGSFALQDFTATSGDLGAKLNSISNNLPMLLSGFGGLGTGIAIAATAGIALYRNWDTITRAFEEKTAIPGATRDIAALKDELDKSKEAMGKLKENTTLTSSEMKKYHQLRENIAATEAKITAEEERQAELKKLMAMRPPEEVEAEKGRQETLEKGIGGQQESLIAAVTEKLNDEAIAAREQERDRIERMIAILTERANEQTGDAQKRTLAALRQEVDRAESLPLAADQTEEAQKIVAKAMTTGNLEAFRQLQEAATERPELFTPEQVTTIQGASPEQLESPAQKRRRETQEANAEEIRKEQETEAGKRREADVRAENLIEEDKKRDATEKKKRLDRTERELGKDFGAESKAIGKGGLETQAEMMVNQFRAGGGKVGAGGRLGLRDFDALTNMIQQQIQQQNPRMPALTAGAHASQIARQAESGVQDKLLGLSGQNLDMQQAHMQVTAELMGTINQISDQQRRVFADLRGLKSEARQTRRRANPPTPTNLPAGN